MLPLPAREGAGGWAFPSLTRRYAILRRTSVPIVSPSPSPIDPDEERSRRRWRGGGGEDRTMHIAPTNKAFDAYEALLADFHDRKVTNEGAVRVAFQTLLMTLAPARWSVIGEQTMPGIRLDGVVKDALNQPCGYWEAKDSGDDLDDEIRKKISKGSRSPTSSSRIPVALCSTRISSGSWTCRSRIARDWRACSRVFLLRRAGSGRLRQGGRGVPRHHPRPRGRAGDNHPRGALHEPGLRRRLRRLPHDLPLLHRPEHLGYRARRDARPAPAHRTALPHRLQ